MNQSKQQIDSNATMRPILLKGHERAISVVKFNYDGDLLFTASKDNTPSMWRTEDGERIGTFDGHKGSVWDLDCDRFSRRLVTASGDATVKLWNCENGECLATFVHHGPVRGVAWAEGSQMFASISDPFVEHPAQIAVYDVPEDRAPSDYRETARLVIELPKDHHMTHGKTPKTASSQRVNPTNVQWTALNEALIVTFDNGAIRLYDPVTGDEMEEFFAHEKKIHRLRFNREKTLLITSSADFTAKLFDAVDFKHLKTYKTDRPVNDAVISETKDHILLGGGQEAMSVTTTSGKVGKFETRFFHLIYEEEFGCVKGHFGPINALAINPDGRSFASGAEDGYIRLHFFDKSYLDMKDPVPEEEDDEPVDDEDDNDQEDGDGKATTE